MQPDKISANGLNLIKSFEGCEKVGADGKVRAYRCPAGRWTIGYGHTKGVRSGMVVTKDEAEDLLREDLETFEQAVRRHISVPLTQNQFDALVSLTFNIGEANLSSSTLKKLLNKGQYNEVPSQIMRWNKARVDGVMQPLSGLTRRRSAEAALFSMDAKLASMGGEKMPQKVEQEAVKPLAQSKTMAGTGIAGLSTILNEVSGQLEFLSSYSSMLQTIFIVTALGGIALAAYARYKDHKEGLR
jgi:lysozyme